MRFSILKRFSHLIHRRVRSESDALDAQITSPLDALARSLSLSHIEHQRLSATHSFTFHEPAVSEFIFPPSRKPTSTTRADREFIHLSSPGKLPGSPVLSPPSPPISRLSSLTHRISALEAENAQLKANNNALQLDAGRREEELAVLRGGFYDERSLARYGQHQVDDVVERVKSQAEKLVEHERFFCALRNVGVWEPLIAFVHHGISAVEDLEEALVDSIRAAAEKPRSPWSKIIPAVIGPRTQEQYVSAINTTIKTRRDLKDSKKATKFWKRTAQRDGENTGVITPSASNISDIQEVISAERHRAVDDLLAKLRSGELPIRSRVVSQVMAKAVPMITSGSSTSSSVHPSTSSDSNALPTDTTSSESLSAIPQASSKEAHGFALTLPPLASQTFKEELIASHSNERFSIKSSYKQMRPTLGNVDLNRDRSISEKAQGKRKSQDTTESGESKSTSYRSSNSDIAATLADAVGPSERSFLNRLSLAFPSSFEPDVFSAESLLPNFVTARQSGSLGMINEESSTDTDHEIALNTSSSSSSSSTGSNDRGGNASSDASQDVDTTLTEDTAPPTFSPAPKTITPVKSRLPVLKRIPRRLSLTLSPSKTKNQSPAKTPPSILKPTISSSLKSTPSPVKKVQQPQMKSVSPLRIKKKAPVDPKRAARLENTGVGRVETGFKGSLVDRGKRTIRRFSRGN